MTKLPVTHDSSTIFSISILDLARKKAVLKYIPQTSTFIQITYVTVSIPQWKILGTLLDSFGHGILQAEEAGPLSRE